jgi:hypothetical protein
MSAVDTTPVLPDTQHFIEALFQDPWNTLRGIHPVEAGLMVVIGLAFLLYGFRIYKVLVILAYAIVGVYLGAMLAGAMNFNPLIGMIGGAIVLGVAAWPLYLIGWGVLGGAVLAGLAAMVTSTFTPSMTYVTIVAVLAGILGVVLTVLLMRPLIIIITSLLGAVLLVEAVLRLSLLAPAFGDQVVKALEVRPLAQAAVVAIPALLGLILQFTDKGGKGAGKGAGKGKAKKEPEGE